MKPYRRHEAIVQVVLNVPEEVENGFDYAILPSAVPLEKVLEKITQDSDLSTDQQSQLKELLWEFDECFTDRPGRTGLIEHDIELTSNEIVQRRPYRVSPRQREIFESELQRMLELGLFRQKVSMCHRS